MYLPRRFAETDLAELDRLVARDAFITLVTTDADGLPFASHLPVLYHRDGDSVRFRGHWARPNPQARHASKALLIVHGPHAYVSPSWYVDPARDVPTWNYAIAHVAGSLRHLDDREQLRALVSELAAGYERAVGSDWQPAHGEPGFEQDLSGIVGFELIAERVDIKFKLSQHYAEADVLGAATGLERRGDPQSVEVAALMRERITRRIATENSR